MFIIPMTGIVPLNEIKPLETSIDESSKASSASQPSFADVFKSILNNAVETDNQVKQDAYNVMLGNIDDLHTVTTNIAKAETALELLVTVKNKAVDAYNEILRMSI